MSLSRRGDSWAERSGDLLIWQVLQNLWHPTENPDGCVSLGVAENALMHSEMVAYVNEKVHIDKPALTYGDGGSGSKAVRAAMARFLTRKLRPVKPIEAAHVCITNGVSCSIEHMCSVLGDEGDVFLLGQPHYGAFIDDIELRPGTTVARVPFGTIDPLSVEAVAAYEQVIQKAKGQGQRVAALILCNPHNPLGRCYSREVLVELMKLCQEHGIHLISDEIYAMSVFRESGTGDETVVPFTSLSSIPTDGLIDPALTHILYGLSKDFGANGLRVGCIVSQHNSRLHQALVPIAIYSYASSLVENVTAKLLTDDAFVDSYIDENCRRLDKNYNVVRRWADSHGIVYTKGTNAAFFLWVNLGQIYLASQARALMEKKDQASNGGVDDATGSRVDKSVQEALLANKVFLASGTAFGSESPGWFRIVFSQEDEILMQGLARIERALGLADISTTLSSMSLRS